ncbi:MAG: hypothetical protein ACI8W8_002880, partial [Rhodothermales bacterium]
RLSMNTMPPSCGLAAPAKNTIPDNGRQVIDLERNR